MPLSARRALRRQVRARAVGLPTRLLASALDALLPTAAVILLLGTGFLRVHALGRYPELFPVDALLRVLYEDPTALLGVPLAWMLLWTALALAQLGSVRTTLGKHLLGLSLRQRDGQIASASRRLARIAASWLVPITLGLAYLWIAVNPERRAWHDGLSGTWVVRVEAADPTAESRPEPRG